MRCTCTLDDSLPRSHKTSDHELVHPIRSGFMLRSDPAHPDWLTGVFDAKRRNQPTDNFKIAHPHRG